MSTTIRPEVHGALRLASRHLQALSNWYSRTDRHQAKRRLIAKHQSKAQKLQMRAERLMEVAS